MLRPVINRLHRDVMKGLQQPDVLAKLTADGTEAVGSSPQQFAAHMKSERAKWVKVIKQLGISVQ